MPQRSCQPGFRQHQDVKSTPFVRASQDILQNSLLHRSDIACKYFLKEVFNFETVLTKKTVRHQVERALHPLFVKLRHFLVANGFRRVQVLQEAMRAELYLLKKLSRPDSGVAKLA